MLKTGRNRAKMTNMHFFAEISEFFCGSI